MIALGDEIAGYWSPDDGLAEQLKDAAHRAGEGLWRMPLQSSYKDGLKSGLADMKNTGPRPGGSITAALFLKEFVKPEIPWAHIDIGRYGRRAAAPILRRHRLWGSHPGGVVPGSCC